MKKKKKSQSGLTLVELLIAIAVSVLVLGSTISIFVIAKKSYRSGSRRLESMQNARIPMYRMTRELRETQEIVSIIPAEEGSAIHNIEFQNPKNTRYEYIEYYIQDSGNMIRSVSHYYMPGNPDVWVKYNTLGSISSAFDEPIASGVTDFNIWGTPLINIKLSISISGEKIDLTTSVFAQNI